MPHPNYILLYVTDPSASAAFYTALLACPPVEASPTFALFALDSGLMLGLWARPGVEPAASAGGGGGELALSVASEAAVDACFADWQARGLTVLQHPVRMDFGYTFVIADPDGHLWGIVWMDPAATPH